jgi:hypothetical protein
MKNERAMLLQFNCVINVLDEAQHFPIATATMTRVKQTDVMK